MLHILDFIGVGAMTMTQFLRRSEKAVEDTKQSIGWAVVAATAALVAAIVSLIVVLVVKR